MLNTLLLAAWIGCQSLDLGTTVYALNTGRFRESNPIMAGPRLVPIKVSVNVGAFIWRRSMKNPTQRHIVSASFAIGGCVPVALNLRTLRQ